jgi:hypothetical protein
MLASYGDLIVAGHSHLVAVDDGNSRQISAQVSTISSHTYLVSLSDILAGRRKLSGFSGLKIVADQFCSVRA